MGLRGMGGRNRTTEEPKNRGTEEQNNRTTEMPKNRGTKERTVETREEQKNGSI
jgi:hypothetical protein